MKGPVSVWQQNKHIKLNSVWRTFNRAALNPRHGKLCSLGSNQKALCVFLTWFRGWRWRGGLIRRRRENDAVQGPGRDFLSLSPPVCVSSSCCCCCCCSIPSPSDCLLCLLPAGVSRCSCTTRPPVENERR